MQSPSLDGSSRDHYSEIYVGYEDNGGVHWNSGIANHFFYLLTVGGKHWNKKYHSSNEVIGVGVSTAFDVYFHAWTNKFVMHTTFHEARVYTLESCKELEYPESVCNSVDNAWKEVGVPDICVDSPIGWYDRDGPYFNCN